MLVFQSVGGKILYIEYIVLFYKSESHNSIPAWFKRRRRLKGQRHRFERLPSCIQLQIPIASTVNNVTASKLKLQKRPKWQAVDKYFLANMEDAILAREGLIADEEIEAALEYAEFAHKAVRVGGIAFYGVAWWQ